jgi:trigger factor
MDWDTLLSMSGVEDRETYDAEQRTSIENAVRTQFVLDAIADAREITVDNDDLSAQIMAQASRNRVSPEQYAQQLQQGGNIAEFVADVRRTKALAQLLERTTITDASGNVVDLEALRPRTVQAPDADAPNDEEVAEETAQVAEAAEAAEETAQAAEAGEQTDQAGEQTAQAAEAGEQTAQAAAEAGDETGEDTAKA